MKILICFIFCLLFTFGSAISAIDKLSSTDSSSIKGCWLSMQSKSEESINDSLYNTSFYYVHFTMCLDEYGNLEINRKIKLDCCNEDTRSFKGTYIIQNDTIIISIDNPRIKEIYNYKIYSNTLLLIPSKDPPKAPDFDKNILLKYRWSRY